MLESGIICRKRYRASPARGGSLFIESPGAIIPLRKPNRKQMTIVSSERSDGYANTDHGISMPVLHGACSL